MTSISPKLPDIFSLINLSDLSAALGVFDCHIPVGGKKTHKNKIGEKQTFLPLFSWHSMSWNSCYFAVLLFSQLLETSQLGPTPGCSFANLPPWNLKGKPNVISQRQKHFSSLAPKHDVPPEFPISVSDTIIHLTMTKKDVLDNLLTLTPTPSITQSCQPIEPPKYPTHSSKPSPPRPWLNQLRIFWSPAIPYWWSFFALAPA